MEQFQKVFEKHKIESIDNNEFDPNVHNAIMQVESETHNEGEVVETYQTESEYQTMINFGGN